MEQVLAYRANDGEYFKSGDECRQHENSIDIQKLCDLGVRMYNYDYELITKESWFDGCMFFECKTDHGASLAKAFLERNGCGSPWHYNDPKAGAFIRFEDRWFDFYRHKQDIDDIERILNEDI